jgi:tetratricopeptide (TPR) repeat protein
VLLFRILLVNLSSIFCRYSWHVCCGLFMLGWLLQQAGCGLQHGQGKHSAQRDTLHTLTLLIEKRPNAPDFYFLRGKVYMERQQLDSAILDFTRAIRWDPRAPELYHYRGVAYKAQERDTLAQQDFTRALELEPFAKGTMGELGGIYAIQGLWPASVHHYRQALRRDSTQASFYIGLAYAQRRMRNPSEAERTLQLARVNANPDPKVLSMLFDLYVGELENLEKAATVTQVLRQEYTNLPITWFNQGYYNYLLYTRSPLRSDSPQRKQYLENAVAAYTKAIQLDPQYRNAYYHRGYMYFTAQNAEPAISDFQKVIELDPKHAEAYFQLGSLFEAYEDWSQAARYYRKATELKPDWSEAQEALKEVEKRK